MVQATDVFIVGGGPAGLAAALAARARGFTVTVADGAKPPIDKACGEGLMPDAVAALCGLHVELQPEEGYDLSGIRFLDGSCSVNAKFPFGKGKGIRRVLLHKKMIERAEAAGIKLLWNTPVTGLLATGVIVGRQEIRARWIVGADGTRSRVRRWSGLENYRHYDFRFAHRRHYAVRPWSDSVEIYWGENAQAYLTPVGQDEICVVVISRGPRVHLEALFHEHPALQRRLEKAEQSSPDRGSITAMHRLERVCCDNVALIGDASGSVDAITGEGLCLSFHQATALASALEAGQLDRYQKEHRRLIRRPTFMGQLILLLDGRPNLRKRVMRALAGKPETFARLLAVHVGGMTPAQAIGAGARVGWELLIA
jgi:flavin-dependent dehydrogenase